MSSMTSIEKMSIHDDDQDGVIIGAIAQSSKWYM